MHIFYELYMSEFVIGKEDLHQIAHAASIAGATDTWRT